MVPQATVGAGSSPRVWGASAHGTPDEPLTRFIPTRVGSILSLSCRPSGISVHPHACGEHTRFRRPLAGSYGSSPRVWGACTGKYSIPLRVGSSPRVWGASVHAARGSTDLRFIPTRVGSIWPQAWPLARPPVHPHACGEHAGLRRYTYVQHGSSPRVWGAYAVLGPLAAARRFIPTRVGSM